MVSIARRGGTPLPHCRGNSIHRSRPRGPKRQFGARLGPGTALAPLDAMSTIRILTLLVLLVSAAGCGATTSSQPDLAASPRELEEGAPGHEHQPETRLPRPLERRAHRGPDAVLERERAVEIAGERLEEHVSGTGAILVPRRPDRKTP